MIIEPALPADAHAIALIHMAARQAAMPWLPGIHTPESTRAYFSNIVLPRQQVLVARDGVQVQGFIAVQDGWLDHLYIAPDHWGQGLGSALLARARSDAETLQLWVFQRNTSARRFYARHGFSERARRDGQHNEEGMPDIRMVWTRPGQGADLS